MKNVGKRLYVAMAVDVDPDANSAVKGRHDALSSPIEYGKVSVAACKKGLQSLFGLFEKYDIDATLFYEARTAMALVEDGMDLSSLSRRHEISCHSLRHEDYLGVVSGLPMVEEDVEDAIAKAQEILRGIFNRGLLGFRAPYTRVNQVVVRVLERMGFQYDSSETVLMDAKWDGMPFTLKKYNSKLLELAMPSFTDAMGRKTSAYLWAIFEGKRGYVEYVDAVSLAKERLNGGLFILSIHPWHLYVDSSGKPFSEAQVMVNLRNLEQILSALKQMPETQIIRHDKYIENWLAGS